MKILQKISVLTVVIFSTITFFPHRVWATTYYNWPKWGCYYLSSSWKKVYVSHQLCSRNDEGTNWLYNYKTKKTYYTWPEGGCFYYSGNYKKNYVKHSYCGR